LLEAAEEDCSCKQKKDDKKPAAEDHLAEDFLLLFDRTASCSGSFGEGFAAPGSDDVADAGELGGEDAMAEAGDAIVAPARVVGEAGFLDELVADHAVDGAVEGAGAELDGSSGGFGGFFHDGVAVFFSVGEGEDDGEDGWG
jgi:hypothetical protein